MSIRLHGASIRSRNGSLLLGPIDTVFGRGLTGILGPNGAGKSTLLKVFAQILTPTEGRIVYEQDGIPLSPLESRLSLGYVPQDLSLYEDMTLKQYLTYIAGLKCIDDVKIHGEIDRIGAMLGLTPKLQRRIEHLSVGEQRKAMIAQAFLGNPLFVLLDEPFAGLDIWERRQLVECLAEYAEEAVVVVTSHFIDEMEGGDYNRLIRMRAGQITEDVQIV